MSPEPDDADSYLWDGSGTPDPLIARMERELRPLAHRGDILPLPSPRRPARRNLAIGFGAVALAAAVVLTLRRPPPEPTSAARGVVTNFTNSLGCGSGASPHVFIASQGSTCEGRPAPRLGALPRGATFEAGVDGARLAVGQLGHLDIMPGSKLTTLGPGSFAHAFRLDSGGVEAVVTAAPRLFAIETAHALAIDLGCAYRIEVGTNGEGTLRVTSGAVELVREGKAPWNLARVPEAMEASLSGLAAPPIPVNMNASESLKKAVYRFDQLERPEDLDTILKQTGTSDARTLFYLLLRAPKPRRSEVLKRLEASWTGRPPSVRREEVIALSDHALRSWSDALTH
jgi:hypothetical protein